MYCKDCKMFWEECKCDDEALKVGLSETACCSAAELKAGMREIYEVWAGSEECDALTATEAYQQHLITEMRDIAAKYLGR